MVTAALVKLVCDVAEQRYGLTQAELLDAALLDAEDLRDPNRRLPGEAWEDLLRFVLRRSGDAALGLRLAEAYDLHLQGFWGYALLSSMSLRERVGLHLRYQSLRAPSVFALRIEGDRAIVECIAREGAEDIFPVIMDCTVANAVRQHRASLNDGLDGEVWLGYREQPHHRELRALWRRRIRFEAPWSGFEFPASELGRRLDGDPHLGRLAIAWLDDELARLGSLVRRELLDEVRARLSVRLTSDPSLARIARDLRMSARTLQRQLNALGASFHDLLEQVRRARAIDYLTKTDHAVEHVAASLGYGDPSNFRRAFRRWTGSAPRAFRAAHRQRASRITARDD